MRVNIAGDIRMTPLARNTIDQAGGELLRQWITSMPGRDVQAAASIAPAGGNFATPVEVTLTLSEPGADVRYTLDGSVPGTADPLYDRPITIAGPTVIRTRAYQDGLTRSIIAQEVLTVGKS